MTHFSDDPFASPREPSVLVKDRPQVYPPPVATWQFVYIVIMLLLYIAVALVGLALVIFRDAVAQDPDFDTDAQEALIMGIFYGVIGGALTVLFAVGLFWRRGMGGWVYNLILIALGMTSCCTWPLTIPLLIFWIRDKDIIVKG